MNVLVTGATGFLGKRLVRSLVKDGLQVRCLVRGTSDVENLLQFAGKENAHLIEVVAGDLMDETSLQQSLLGCEVVYHCAAGMNEAAATIFLNTVVPTRKLVQAVQSAKTPRFVLVSSLGVYGAGVLPKQGTLDETCPVDPKPQLRDSYTFSKVVQEEIVWEAHKQHNLPVVVIRPGVIFGPGRGALSARVGLKVGPLQLRFGNRTLPYTFVENCADAIKQAGLVPDVVGQAFNVLDDNLPTCKEVIQAYRHHGKKVRSAWVPQWTVKPMSRLYESYHRWSKGQLPNVITTYRSEAFWKPLHFPNTKAKQALHWQPAVPMTEALRRAILEL
jgi:nucleoside-diphosphate-sugar epimerase